MIMLRSYQYLELTYKISKFLLAIGGKRAQRAIQAYRPSLELAISEWINHQDMTTRRSLRAAIYDLVEASVEPARVDAAIENIDRILGLSLPHAEIEARLAFPSKIPG